MNKSKIAFYRKRFCDELEGILKQGSSVYINGQFGCGKTTAIREWKEKKEPNALWLDGENADFAEKIRRASGGKIIVDDIHKLNATQIEAVVQRIKKNGTQFIFIGCAQLPPWLKQLFLNWKLEVMGAEKLVMDVEEIETILMTNRINFNIEIVHEIQEETKGYPMAVSLLVHYMAEGRNLDEVLKKQVKKDMLDIFEREISVKFDKELKEVLWCMVWFHAFSTELANFVCENQDKESWLTKLQKIPYFFVEQEGTWTWIPAYRQFFMKKQSDESREIRKKQSCNRGGLYYESKGEFVRALYYYHEAENEEKVSKILLQDSQNYAGVGRFYETEPYYRALSKEFILKSPHLMAYMSMLCSLHNQVEESEMWYSALENYSEKQEKGSQEERTAQGRLGYLRLTLPHRGTVGIEQEIKEVALKIKDKVWEPFNLDVTENMPGIINGGKDFCLWAKDWKWVKETLSDSLALVLGKSGPGVENIGLGELLFEKGETPAEAMILVNRGLFEASTHGKPQVEFAAVGVLAKILVRMGSCAKAVNLADEFYGRAEEKNWSDLIPNIKALRVELSMFADKRQPVVEWMNGEKNDGTSQFLVLERYQYMVRVKGLLWQGKNSEALMLASKLLVYAQKYKRPYIEIQAHIFIGVALGGMDENQGESHIWEAVVLSKKLQIVEPVISEGRLVIHMLRKLNAKDAFVERLIEGAERQASMYPNYIREQRGSGEALTKTEKNVLRLLSKGLKYSEIGDILGIKLSTVKFHTSNIYSKMGVNGKSQAIRFLARNDMAKE